MANRSRKGRPWGWIGGLLGGSLVILVGVGRGIAPEVILFRAAAAACAIGLTARLVAYALRPTEETV